MLPPLIVSAHFAPETQTMLDRLRTQYFPKERNYLGAHLTLFHAIPGSIEAEAALALADVVTNPAPEASLTGLMPLGRGFAVRVQAPQLRDMHTTLQEQFASCLTPQDLRPWRPHVTLQNKVEPARAKVDCIQASQHFVPLTTHVVSLRLWQYLNGPWRLIRSFEFAVRT